MQRPRTPVVIGIIAVVAAVIALSVVAVRTTSPANTSSTVAMASQSPQATVVEPAATPSPTVDPTIAWADEVCTAAAPVSAQIVAVSDDLVVPAPGGLDEIRTRLRERGDRVLQQLEPLTVALGQVPVDVPEAVAVANELSTEVEDLRTEAAALTRSIDALTQADGVVAFGLAIPDAVTAAGRSASAAGAVGSTVRDTLSVQGSRLGDAFEASAACQALARGIPAQ